MLNVTSRSVVSRLITCSNGSAPQSAKTMHKNLSQSQACTRKYIINDHYEFDKKVINSDNPVIVNFHAEWCDPCKILTPKMSKLLENSNEIDLAVIDVDANTELVETFEVKAVPAVLAFRNGVVVDKFIGLAEANSIEDLIERLKKKNRGDGGDKEEEAKKKT